MSVTHLKSLPLHAVHFCDVTKHHGHLFYGKNRQWSPTVVFAREARLTLLNTLNITGREVQTVRVQKKAHKKIHYKTEPAWREPIPDSKMTLPTFPLLTVTSLHTTIPRMQHFPKRSCLTRSYRYITDIFPLLYEVIRPNIRLSVNANFSGQSYGIAFPLITVNYRYLLCISPTPICLV